MWRTPSTAAFPAAITLPQGKTVLDFQLDCLRAGDRPLARDVRLHVAGPRRVAILGENGRGKITLLRLIWEELRLRRDIRAGYMPQNYGDVLDDRQTPVDYLAPSGDKERRTKACTLLGSLKFTPDEMRRPIAALSGGQKAKLLLAGLLLDGCDVLVLDEPTPQSQPPVLVPSSGRPCPPTAARFSASPTTANLCARSAPTGMS